MMLVYVGLIIKTCFFIVNDLRPHDIGVVAAIGDSALVGYFAVYCHFIKSNLVGQYHPAWDQCIVSARI